jgi:hypothetical protein
MISFRFISKIVSLILLSTCIVFLDSSSLSIAHAESRIGNGSWHIDAQGGTESVRWDVNRLGAKVTLTRNGRQVQTSGVKGEYQIGNIAPGAIDNYVLSFVSPITQDRAALLAERWGDTPADVISKIGHVATGTLTIQMPSSGAQSADAAAGLPNSTKFRYTTFIPEAFRPDPPLACTDLLNPLTQRFVGDNRQPDPNSSKYRTRIDVNIDWTAFSAFTVSKSTGPTRREELVITSLLPYSTEWRLNSQKYASTSTMSVARTGSPGWNYLSFSIAQNVKDPLCDPALVSGVYFDYKVTISRTNGYQMDGEAAVFPTHEVYFQNSNDNVWHEILVLPTQDWFCLLPTAGIIPWNCKQTHSEFGTY